MLFESRVGFLHIYIIEYIGNNFIFFGVMLI